MYQLNNHACPKDMWVVFAISGTATAHLSLAESNLS